MIIHREDQNIYEEVNDRLSDYMERNCSNCYCQINKDGRIHLDDRFKPEHLKGIIEILKRYKII